MKAPMGGGASRENRVAGWAPEVLRAAGVSDPAHASAPMPSLATAAASSTGTAAPSTQQKPRHDQASSPSTAASNSVATSHAHGSDVPHAAPPQQEGTADPEQQANIVFVLGGPSSGKGTQVQQLQQQLQQQQQQLQKQQQRLQKQQQQVQKQQLQVQKQQQQVQQLQQQVQHLEQLQHVADGPSLQLLPELWQRVAAGVDGQGKKALRLACHEACQGLSATVSKLVVQAEEVATQLPEGLPLFSPRLSAVQSIKLQPFSHAALARPFAVALEATSRLRMPPPISTPLLAGLRELDLQECRFGADGASLLAAALTASTGITGLCVLHLGSTQLKDDGVQHVCEALTGAPHLAGSIEVLDLSDNGYGERGAEAIARLLSSSTPLCRLQELRLNGRRYTRYESIAIGPRGCESLADGLRRATTTRLAVLDLGAIGAGPEGCRAVAAALQAATQLTGLQSLVLDTNGTRDEGASALAAMLQGSKHVASMLQELNLRGNGIRKDGIKALARALKAAMQLTGLQRLRLGGNGIGFREVADSVRHSMHLSNLEELELSCVLPFKRDSDSEEEEDEMDAEEECTALADALEHGSHLSRVRSLDLRHNNLGAVGGRALARALLRGKHLGALEELNLADTDLDGFGRGAISAFSDLQPPGGDLEALGVCALANTLLQASHLRNLRCLVLMKVTMAIESIAALARALRDGVHLSSLEKLDLQSTSVGPKGMAFLAAALRHGSHLSRLQSIDLSDNEALELEGAAALAAALQHGSHLSRLQSLNLSRNGMKPEGMADLAAALQHGSHLSRLQSLNLSDNDLSSVGGRALAQALLDGTHLGALEVLDLQSTSLDNLRCLGVLDLASALLQATHMRRLQSLNLDYVKMGSGSVAALATALRHGSHLSSLTRLGVADCHIDADGRALLLSAVQGQAEKIIF